MNNKLKQNRGSFTLKLINRLFSIFICILFFVFLSLYFFDIYLVTSNSMNNTLFQGDYVFVLKQTNLNKLDYCKGDIVLFRKNENSKTVFIKRIIGLLNDSICLKDSTSLFVSENQINLLKIYSHDKEFVIRQLQEYYMVNIFVNNREDYFYYPFPLKNFREISKQSNIKGIDSIKVVFNLYYANDDWIESDIDPINTSPILGRNVENFETGGNETKNDFIAGNEYFVTRFYYLMGDNIPFSIDSRDWGSISQNCFIGKALFAFNFKRYLFNFRMF